MDKELLDYIKILTKEDSKTLSQKGLKAAEEVGELAKVVLPFDNAFATNHRFVEREKILEEVADVYLTAISIAYDLGFDDEEIENMISQKTSKWASLIAREKELKWPMPYEIHVTVSNVNKEHFFQVCKNLDVKPIVLDIQKNDGRALFEDVMTSSRHFGDNRSAYEELERICKGLECCGIKIVRRKIETAVWHPAAPHDLEDMPPNCYYECHVGVITNDKTVDIIKDIASTYDAHMSRNIYKKLENDQYVIMLTYRTYKHGKGTFEEKVKNMIRALDTYGFQYKNITKEFSIYDSKVSHDTSWINS